VFREGKIEEWEVIDVVVGGKLLSAHRVKGTSKRRRNKLFRGVALLGWTSTPGGDLQWTLCFGDETSVIIRIL